MHTRPPRFRESPREWAWGALSRVGSLERVPYSFACVAVQRLQPWWHDPILMYYAKGTTIARVTDQEQLDKQRAKHFQKWRWTVGSLGAVSLVGSLVFAH